MRSITGSTMSPPAQRPGRSRQDWCTPLDFVAAVQRRFGPFVCDLAADADNALAPAHYDAAANALAQPWAEQYPTGVLWCNPPYRKIKPWAQKAASESHRRNGLILMLVPAAVSTEWYARYAAPYAHTIAVRPRLTFVGATAPYPKDLMLLVYQGGLGGFSTWRWCVPAWGPTGRAKGG